MSFFSELDARSNTITGQYPSIIIRHFGIPSILEPDAIYDRMVGESNSFWLEEEKTDDPSDEEEDDDPRCVCGVYRSEHSAMGCSEGFQTPKEWASEREAIRGMDEDTYERIYHPEG